MSLFREDVDPRLLLLLRPPLPIAFTDVLVRNAAAVDCAAALLSTAGRDAVLCFMGREQ